MPAIALYADPHPAAGAAELVRTITRRRFLGEYGDPERAAEAGRAWAERVLPHARLLRIRAQASGDEHGHVWVLAEGDDLGVLTLSLDDVQLAPDVRALLLDLARAEGCRRLTVGITPEDTVLERFVHGGSFEIGAFQMRLELDDRPPDEVSVDLEPMGRAAFEEYLAYGTEEYAVAREKAGETRERAREVAREQMAALLPQGLETAGHHFFHGMVRGERIGVLWLGTERPTAFVYDIEIAAEHQRRGYGAALMRAGASWSRDHGALALGLNVFGYNHAAKALYDRLGYDVIETFLAHLVGTGGVPGDETGDEY